MSDRSNFGTTLRSTRESLDWTIEDVAHRTRIPLATLRQLEQSDYSNFPSQSYAKSFLAQYAEHLDVDATEEIDSFESRDSFANLDSYEYLKDHDEHVDAKPLVTKRPKRKKEKVAKEERVARPGRPAAMQPLMVFSVTALLITVAVFGFMKLSEKLEQVAPTADTRPEESLAPIDGLSTQPPATNELTNVPRALPVTSEGNLVAGDPSATIGTVTLNATPSTQVLAPNKISLDNPPPRAVVVEE